MAISDEIRQQRESLKGQGLGAYITYFKDYYLLRTVVVIAAIWFVFTLVRNALTAKEQVLGAYFLNAYEADNELAGSIQEDVSAYLGINDAKESVLVDLSRYLQPGNQSGDTTGMTTQTVLLTYTGAGMLDVLAADAANFDYYLERGVYGDLREFLTEEELEQWEDQLIYVSGETYLALQGDDETVSTETVSDSDAVEAVTEQETGSTYEALMADVQHALDAEKIENYVRPDPEQMKNPVPVGIMIHDTDFVRNTEIYDGTAAIAGIIYGTRHPENAAAFIRYVMTEDGPEAESRS